jgi:hypothetical protein
LYHGTTRRFSFTVFKKMVATGTNHVLSLIALLCFINPMAHTFCASHYSLLNHRFVSKPSFVNNRAILSPRQTVLRAHQPLRHQLVEKGGAPLAQDSKLSILTNIRKVVSRAIPVGILSFFNRGDGSVSQVFNYLFEGTTTIAWCFFHFYFFSSHL